MPVEKSGEDHHRSRPEPGADSTASRNHRPAALRGPGRRLRERHSVKQQLDTLVSEMIDRGILFSDARREFEKRFIARVLQRHRGNLSRAAKDLKIHRNTLATKIEEYKI